MSFLPPKLTNQGQRIESLIPLTHDTPPVLPEEFADSIVEQARLTNESLGQEKNVVEECEMNL